ncbi:MAG: CocE/NonD family hydrolase [Actinomycetota bacterium]|nr:CocE/NonD family hydrolase [Actinomycetota bacterium]
MTKLRKRLWVDEASVPMRDGTSLFADVCVPDDGKRHPVFFIRTPYSRSASRAVWDPVILAANGWAVVSQDVRGCFSSEGTFQPFHQEIGDGYDSVKWCASQPWSNGNVITAGWSYPGAAALLAAVGKPKALRAVGAAITGSDYAEDWFWERGVLKQGFAQAWATNLAAGMPWRSMQHRLKALGMTDNWRALYDKPLGTSSVGEMFEPYLRWMDPHDKSYWHPIRLTRHHRKMDVAGFHVAGWYDIFCEGSIANYLGLKNKAPTGYARDSQRLIIGPWTHDALYMRNVGQADLGIHALGIDVPDKMQAWLKRAAEGKPVKSGVRAFMLGTNIWREFNQWPPPSKPIALYLGSRLGANSLNGDGALSRHVPTASEDHFIYDPFDPVPTLGGRGLDPVIQMSGAFDQWSVESRDDVLVYTGDRLERDLIVAGEVIASITFATTGQSADITAKLVDVYPDGSTLNVLDSVQRATFKPGKPRTVEVKLGNIAAVFVAGHRVRLQVSSSNFPRLDRNPSTGVPSPAATALKGASQTVFVGGIKPSLISLPVLAR